jgi:ADP-ribose pyrophosphatase YjhB (NUDIX family)
MKYTCGIYLFDLERDAFLTVHPTNAPINVWSIPKGLPNIGEDLLDAAIREFREETSVDLLAHKETDMIFSMPERKYVHGNKVLASFLVVRHGKHTDILHCESMVNDHAMIPVVDGLPWLHQYDVLPFPEVDGYWWMPFKGIMHLHETQQANITAIREITQKVRETHKINPQIKK